MESKAMTDDVKDQVHTTSQEAEPTQQDVTELDQSTSEPGDGKEATGQADNEEGKDPNGWALKRIGALTAKSHQAERDAQTARGEAERYRQLLEQMRSGEKPADPKPGETPNIEELVAKRAEEIAQQKAMAERGQSVSKVGAEQFPDFMSAVQTLDALGISGEQVQSLLGMDGAHKVIYSLGKNPEEAERILSLPPLQQGRELEKLANKPAPVAPPKAVSQAPAPVKPIDGGVTTEKDPTKMSTSEWMAWREKTKSTRF